MRRPLAAALLLALAAGGCNRYYSGIPGQTSKPRLSRKMVVRKQEPRELIASDGSSCVTSDGRWEKVQVGSSAWCLWSPGA